MGAVLIYYVLLENYFSIIIKKVYLLSLVWPVKTKTHIIMTTAMWDMKLFPKIALEQPKNKKVPTISLILSQRG